MTLLEVQHHLRDAIGLDIASIGIPAVRRAVHLRVAATRGDLARYFAYLKQTPSELQELIDAIVVSETWFFRDPASFAAVVTRLRERPEWVHPTSSVRILSLPCSTGEEPYSIAMALLNAGLQAERFRIDAIDISARALSAAKLGLYRRHSFRGRR